MILTTVYDSLSDLVPKRSLQVRMVESGQKLKINILLPFLC